MFKKSYMMEYGLNYFSDIISESHKNTTNIVYYENIQTFHATSAIRHSIYHSKCPMFSIKLLSKSSKIELQNLPKI